VGGFFNGYVHLLFLKEPKFNRTYQFNLKTISCVSFVKRYQMLLLGDSSGVVLIYRLTISPKQLEFEEIRCIRAHDGKINELTVSEKANLFCVCSEDGSLSLYNLFSRTPCPTQTN
jgi:WD40 repeat protein